MKNRRKDKQKTFIAITAMAVYKTDDFNDAKLVASTDATGCVCLVNKDNDVEDRIWPKKPDVIGWQELNAMLLTASGINKPERPKMFHYVVTGISCNGAGEDDSWTEYSGNSREQAIKAIRKCSDWMGYSCSCAVLGREKLKAEKERKAQEEAEADYMERCYAAEGPDVLEFADGTLAFDDGSGYELVQYEKEHGKIVERYPFWDYFYSLNKFATHQNVKNIHHYQ